MDDTHKDPQLEELKKRNQVLRQSNDLKDSLIAMAAHDLRNPVAFIQTVAKLLNNPKLHLTQADRKEYLGNIIRQTDYLFQMLDELLDLAQNEQGELALHPESIDIPALLREAATRHEVLAGAKNTHIQLKEVPAGTVLADPLRLRQVLDNLIGNAVKFSPPASLISLDAQHDKLGWRISVSDQGPGFTDEDRVRMLDDYTRLSAKPTAGEKSSGLGLAITQQLIKAHGGQFGVDAQPGQGSTIWFWLPAKRED